MTKEEQLVVDIKRCRELRLAGWPVPAIVKETWEVRTLGKTAFNKAFMMKRDCGNGPLIPIGFEVVSCLGKSDVETTTKHTTLDEAKTEFIKRKAKSFNTVCSNVRMYAKDKQGYCNCVRSWTLDTQFQTHETDRLDEL